MVAMEDSASRKISDYQKRSVRRKIGEVVMVCDPWVEIANCTIHWHVICTVFDRFLLLTLLERMHTL